MDLAPHRGDRPMRALLALALATGLAAACKPWGTEDLDALDAAPGYAALAAGLDRTCGLGADGRAWCWGQAVIGTLFPTDRCYQRQDIIGVEVPPVECIKRPIRVAGDHKYSAIASGFSGTLAVDQSGTLWGWGWNFYGVLNSTALDSAQDYPRIVEGSGTWRFKTVSPPGSSACGVTDDGRLICWGERNLVTARIWSGATCTAGLGRCVVAPTQIGTATTWKQVVVGTEHACALDATGAAFCWGAGQRGQLGSTSLSSCPTTGTATMACRLDPTAVAGTARFTTLSAAGDFTCGIATAGTLMCWGTGSATASTPVQIGASTSWTSISVGGQGITAFAGSATCGTRSDGTWWCFGVSPVGGGSNLRQILGAPALQGVAVGDDHACGWTATGDAWCFGDKHNGAVGDGTVAYTFAAAPAQVALPYRN